MATAAQRYGLLNLITSNGDGLIAYAAQCAGDTNVLPVEACFLLGMAAGSTYGAASTRIAASLTNGTPPLIG